jgi:hypothetical protein
MRPLAALSLVIFSACFAAPHEISPIVAATRAGDVATIRELTARGDDANAPSGGNGWTPLMHAVHKKQLASVNALIAAGADPNRASGSGMTPLMMAAAYGYADIVQALLAGGANPRLRDGSGETALDYALTGMTDIDQFTFFSCEDGVVHALVRAGARSASPSSRRWAKMKRCESASLVP